MSKIEAAKGPWRLERARTLVNIKGANGEQICQIPVVRMADAVLIVNAVNSYGGLDPNKWLADNAA